MWFVVTEEIEYRVEASDEEAAIQHVIDDGDRDKHCFQAVTDRYAYEDDAGGRNDNIPHR